MRFLPLTLLLAGCAPPVTSEPAAPRTAASGTAAPETAGSSVPPVTEVPVEAPEGCPADLDARVGTVVTLVGEQSRTKIPTVCGVDVDGDYDLSDEVVRVTGRLRRYVVPPPTPGEPIVAGRGPGTYYSIQDPTTGQLARPVPR
ncbi:MAG: hypothetical protein KC776_33255 [Myxococcales bacterium]|nr:hypothetical protein [Myxococcales bacterium]MCB9583464.1 hypothetical protein [Polyangiaceae bacterium]